MASKKEVFEVRALKWGNLSPASEYPEVTVKTLTLAPFAVTGGKGKPLIISQPFQDRDGKVKYCRYDHETGKWDKQHLSIAQLRRGSTDIIFLGAI